MLVARGEAIPGDDPPPSERRFPNAGIGLPGLGAVG